MTEQGRTVSTPRTQLPEFMRSAMMGALVSAHLAELAETTEEDPRTSPTGRAEQQMLRQAAREISDYHAARS